MFEADYECKPPSLKLKCNPPVGILNPLTVILTTTKKKVNIEDLVFQDMKIFDRKYLLSDDILIKVKDYCGKIGADYVIVGEEKYCRAFNLNGEKFSYNFISAVFFKKKVC